MAGEVIVQPDIVAQDVVDLIQSRPIQLPFIEDLKAGTEQAMTPI